MTGDTSFVMENGVGTGLVMQRTGIDDLLAGRQVPFDAGVYGQVSAPAADTPGLEISLSPEFSRGVGDIHHNFDGASTSFGVSTPFGGASVSTDRNGHFNGVSIRPLFDWGASVNTTITGSWTVRDWLGSR
jgi:hypothetical protein